MCIRQELSHAQTAFGAGGEHVARSSPPASRPRRRRSSPRTCRRSHSTPRRRGRSTSSSPRTARSRRNGASPTSSSAEGVAGRVIGDRAREARADVLDPEHVGEELRELPRPGRARLDRRRRAAPGSARRTARHTSPTASRRRRRARRCRRSCGRAARASAGWPELRWICPQHVCSPGRLDLDPEPLQHRHRRLPDLGKSVSARHVTNSPTRSIIDDQPTAPAGTDSLAR